MLSAPPNRGQILELMAAFRPACVIGGAAELGVFELLSQQSLDAATIAARLGADLRGTVMLLDAVAALGLLHKQDDRYTLPAELQPLLGSGAQSILPMVFHSMNIMRGWIEVARVAKSGRPGPRLASLRGAEADRAAFVAAMHTVSGPVAEGLVARLGPPRLRRLLDVGGASGTWTMAFLNAVPDATAILFDLPDAIQQAQTRLAGTPLQSRVTLAAGDFYHDELPRGADYAWVSAIIHQHSRQHSRELYARIYRALESGGTIGIRDLVMEPDRTRPLLGALFAINMLVNTETGMTYTFQEIAEDLQSAGFVEPRLSIPSDDMHAVVEARRP